MSMPFEILGQLGNDLRSRRAQGSRAAELLRFLLENGVDLAIAAQYFRAAFGRGFASFRFCQSLDGAIDWDRVNAEAEPGIDALQETWSTLPALPDLASRRDREAFRSVARRRGVYLLVCALDRERDATPPSPPYRLSGVYQKDTGANLWRPGTGEAIRAELNLALGGERIRSGPQDPWEFRNDARAFGDASSKVPVHCFEPGSGNVKDLLDLGSLRRWYESRSIAWPFTEEAQTT